MTVETKATTEPYMDPVEKKVREMPVGELMTWIQDLVNETCDAAERASILTVIALDKLPNSTDDDESRAVLRAMSAQFSNGDFRITELVSATTALADKLNAQCAAEVQHG